MGYAQTVDKHWELLQAHLSLNKTVIAHAIVSKYELPGDSGPVTGQYKTIAMPTFAKGEPLRELSEKTEAGFIGIKMAAMDFGIAHKWANHPDELFSTANSVEFIGSEQENGETYSILQVRSAAAKGDAPVRAKIWVNEKNSHPLRVDGIIEKVPLPGIKQVNFTITYKTGTDGRSLPHEITVFYPISIFFHRGSVFFQHTLGEWHKKSP